MIPLLFTPSALYGARGAGRRRVTFARPEPDPIPESFDDELAVVALIL